MPTINQGTIYAALSPKITTIASKRQRLVHTSCFKYCFHLLPRPRRRRRPSPRIRQRTRKRPRTRIKPRKRLRPSPRIRPSPRTRTRYRPRPRTRFPHTSCFLYHFHNLLPRPRPRDIID